MTSDRFQRPMTPAGARAASVTHTDLPPHPPDVRDEEVSHLLAVEFPIGLRGYDRAEVDAYVQRASRVIAELQASRSPQSAVRYALEQVSEETRAILQQAHDTADEVTTRSRAQAAERLEVAEREAAQVRAAAEREAADLRAAADRRVQEAEDEVAEIWQERERLIEDARDVAARLAELADDAAGREMPPSVAMTESETRSLPAPPIWDDEVEDDEDEVPPAPMLQAVPPPPFDAAPEPALADAPPPPSDAPGPLAYEDDSELGPMDEPAADPAVDEPEVPTGDTVEFELVDRDDDETAERDR